MKLISWNVNGFRACLKKGFEDFFNSVDADVFCIQETKMKPDQADFEPAGYKKIFHSAERAGYSGTAVFTIPSPEESGEGRSIQESISLSLFRLDYRTLSLLRVTSRMPAPNTRMEPTT